MRIDPNVVVFPVTNTTAGDPQKPRVSGSREGASVVSLSASATAATQDHSEVLDARLERIKALIDRGEYPIDLDMLSSRIVEDDILRGSGA